MAKAPAEVELPESDAFEDARHPRLTQRLIGHAAAEAAMLQAYHGGRLAHAWLIGGPPGIGKATLAWRFARFALAYPDREQKDVREARDLSVPPEHPAARQLAAMSHPDFALIRREWNPKSKSLFTEIRVDDVRAGQGVFHKFSTSGGWRAAIVDSADDLNKNSANALLKTIEEPPERAMILIVAHRPGRLPPTIRSRCRRLLLEPLAPSDRSANSPAHKGQRLAANPLAILIGTVPGVAIGLKADRTEVGRSIGRTVAAVKSATGFTEGIGHRRQTTCK